MLDGDWSSDVCSSDLVWAAVIAVIAALFLLRIMKKRHFVLASVFAVSGFLHLVLDSFAGDIWWLAPAVDRPYALTTVPARLHPWWLNFIVHWSFFVEIMVFAWAFRFWRRSCKRGLHPDTP
jgi:inner membrane protein